MTIILLTGAPGSGKTTAIRRIVEALPRKSGGFYTREIRKAGARFGFEIVTLDGQDGILAHVEIKGQPRVGRYGVDLTALEDIGIERIEAAARRGALVVIDEIGPMEVHSTAFRQAVETIFNSGADVLGTIAARPHPFTDAIKARPDVTLIEITPARREAVLAEVLALLAGSAS
jgi:nucleoside-triphosphatase